MALAKLSFDGIKSKTEQTANSDPIFPSELNAEAELVAASILDLSEQHEAIGAQLEQDKNQLARHIVRPWFLKTYHGAAAVPSSCIVKVGARGVRVAFKDAYARLNDESVILSILGESNTKRLFRQKFEVKVDGDRIPEKKQQDVIDALAALTEKFNLPDGTITFSAYVAPVPGFKEKRFTELPLEQSLALEEKINGGKGLTQMAVSTKGVKV